MTICRQLPWSCVYCFTLLQRGEYSMADSLAQARRAAVLARTAGMGGTNLESPQWVAIIIRVDCKYV